MKNNLLLAAAFTEGFFLLAYELFSAQLLHPLYGSSYFVWVAILAVTMLASAIGYFLGGFVTGRKASFLNKYVAFALIVITLYSLSVHTINLNVFLKIAEVDLIYATLIQAMSLLFIPLVLITSFSPIIVKFYNDINSGNKASKVFTLSTIGGIASVYLTAFVFLPMLDLILFIKLISLSILLISVTFYILSKWYKSLAIHFVLSFFIFMGFTVKQKDKLKGKNTEILYRSHGIMGEIEIREEHNSRRYISLNRTTQSAIKKSDFKSLWSYPYRVATYASLAPTNADVLVAGLGGGILVNDLIDLNFNVDCIEFDRRMVGVAKKYMGLKANVNIEIDDFRHYINYSPKKYDLIILDLSKGESLPINVYTVEAFAKMFDMLKPDGFILLHYFSDVYGTGKFGLKSVMKTMQVSGGFVKLIKKHDKNPEQIIIASNSPEILKSYNYKVPLNYITDYNFETTQIFDKTFNYNEGIILRDGNNALEKIQLIVVKEIRERLRKNEKAIFKNK